MKKIYILILLLGTLFSCTRDEFIAPEEENFNSERITQRQKDLCVMTWNAFLLDTPDIGGGPQCEGASCIARANEVCQRVLEEDPDVINLQEVFEEEARDALVSCLRAGGYRHIRHELDAGLLTASKFPITTTYFEEYESEHGWLGHGWDTHKSKGFLSTRIKLDSGCYLQNINTHTDAGEDCESAYARLNQLIQLNNYMSGVNSDIPILIGGDFNIDVHDDDVIDFCWNDEFRILVNDNEFPIEDLFSKNEFDLLKQIMDADPVHEIFGTSIAPTASAGQVLDYFLLRNNANNVTITSVENPDVCPTVECWEIMQENQHYDYDDRSFVVCDEADMQYYVDTGEYYVVDSWTYEDCVSDHQPVKTCMTVECPEPDPCDSCLPTEYCLNGICYPEIEDDPCDCRPDEECVRGECIPI